MDLWAVARSGRVFRSVSLAMLLAFGTALALPAISHADADDFDNQLRKKRFGQSTGTVTTNSNAGSHSQGSGVKATTETTIVTDGAITPFLTGDSAAAMQAVADKYAAVVAQGGWPKVPSGKLKKGATGKGPAALNKRLFMEGYLRSEATEGEFAQVFTSATEDALRRFQRNHGLAVTGVIDGPTLGALNVPAERRLSTIKANIPRLAEYSKDLGTRYVVVNIPAQQIETVQRRQGLLAPQRHRRPSVAADAGGHDTAHNHPLQPVLERTGVDRRKGHRPPHDVEWRIEGDA